jgi:AraC-like DNA-binding protein
LRLPNLRLVPPPRTPALFARLRFDPALETQALEQLSRLDFAAARDTLARLAGQLDLTAQLQASEAALLLADVLQRVNRRLHRATEIDASGALNRADLIARFAPLSSAESARDAFLVALDALLADIRPAGGVHPLVERAQGFIEENYHRRLSLSGIAKVLNVSPNYLSRIVRRETGTTVTARIHSVRLEHARLLLARGGRSISEIAYTVGYQNYRDFYRNFVKYERSSPRKARRLMTRLEEAPPPRE